MAIRNSANERGSIANKLFQGVPWEGGMLRFEAGSGFRSAFGTGLFWLAEAARFTCDGTIAVELRENKAVCASVRKGKADVEFVRPVETKEHFGIPHSMLRADAQKRGNVIEVHRFRFFRCPIAVTFEKATRRIDNQTLERFWSFCHSHKVESKASD
jgi:hypothetical protein